MRNIGAAVPGEEEDGDEDGGESGDPYHAVEIGPGVFHYFIRDGVLLASSWTGELDRIATNATPAVSKMRDALKGAENAKAVFVTDLIPSMRKALPRGGRTPSSIRFSCGPGCWPAASKTTTAARPSPSISTPI
ncbi:MAG: hypothetical protein M5R36_13515 [Deltaproteobacteria bacterium]|nr:hypothetical protein [Deltaproteobacteria bacterium]